MNRVVLLLVLFLGLAMLSFASPTAIRGGNNAFRTDSRVRGTFSSAPEPASLLFVGTGLLTLSGLIRKRLNKK